MVTRSDRGRRKLTRRAATAPAELPAVRLISSRMPRASSSSLSFQGCSRQAGQSNFPERASGLVVVGGKLLFQNVTKSRIVLDSGHFNQGLRPAFSGFQVGALLDEEADEVQVPVHHGKEEGGPAAAVPGVNVCPEVQQRSGRFRVAIAGGCVEGGGVLIGGEADVRVGAVLEEMAQDVRLSFPGRGVGLSPCSIITATMASISIVICAFNEEKHIGRLLYGISRFMAPVSSNPTSSCRLEKMSRSKALSGSYFLIYGVNCDHPLLTDYL